MLKINQFNYLSTDASKYWTIPLEWIQLCLSSALNSMSLSNHVMSITFHKRDQLNLGADGGGTGLVKTPLKHWRQQRLQQSGACTGWLRGERSNPQFIAVWFYTISVSNYDKSAQHVVILIIILWTLSNWSLHCFCTVSAHKEMLSAIFILHPVLGCAVMRWKGRRAEQFTVVGLQEHE